MTSVAVNVDQLFYKVPGGIGTYIRHLLPALREVDPQLDLSAFHARFDGSDPAELNGIRTLELERGIRTLYPLWNLAGRPALPGSLAGVDVIHALSAVAIPPVRPGQKLIVTVHDLAFRFFPEAFPRSWRMLYLSGVRRAVREASAVIAVSRHTADDVAELGPMDPSKIHVVPLAGSMTIGTADPTPILERLRVPRPYILFVGTLEPRKNVVRLINAYRHIASSVPHALVLAGPPGWGAEPIRKALAEPGHGNIVVTGRIPEEELDALHRGADVFAYPSLYEGFGLPVLDAMARGVPVLTSNTSALLELTGKAAMRMTPGSTGAIAAALESLLGDEKLKSRLSEAGQERARDFSWERTARETLDVYESAPAR